VLGGALSCRAQWRTCVTPSSAMSFRVSPLRSPTMRPNVAKPMKERDSAITAGKTLMQGPALVSPTLSTCRAGSGAGGRAGGGA
jgi:hypothetical protein